MEYIPYIYRIYTFREFQKIQRKSSIVTLQVGDIVNIFEEKQPRQK